MAQGEYGGFEYEFVEEVDPKYYCMVCQNVTREPMLTECCGQHYCYSCLQQCNMSSFTRECPHCRCSNYSVMLDKQMQREINEMEIYCTKRLKNSCLWEGEIASLSQHLRSSSCPQKKPKCKFCTEIYSKAKKDHLEECPEYAKKYIEESRKHMKGKERERFMQEEVICTLQGPNESGEVLKCGKKMRRSELASHEKYCLFRKFQCKFCNKESTYTAITGQTNTDHKQPKVPQEKGHYAECPSYPLYCKNKCTRVQIKRADMDEHIKECPLELIPCERWEEGCREKVQRKDMSKHMKAYKKEHGEYVWCSYIHKKQEVEEVRGELAATKNELTALINELATTKNELTASLNELAATKNELTATRDQVAAVNAELISTKQNLVSKTCELNALSISRNGGVRAREGASNTPSESINHKREMLKTEQRPSNGKSSCNIS